jgi:hypothetical protein
MLGSSHHRGPVLPSLNLYASCFLSWLETFLQLLQRAEEIFPAVRERMKHINSEFEREPKKKKKISSAV